MDWSQVSNAPTFECIDTSIVLKVYGSLYLNLNMSFNFNGHLYFESLNLGNEILTSGQILDCPIDFNGFGGSWELLDALSTTQLINLNCGSLNTKNHNITSAHFYATTNAPSNLELGTSTITLTDPSSSWVIFDTLLNIDADSSVIKLLGYYHPHFLHTQCQTRVNYNEVLFTSPTTNVVQESLIGNAYIRKIYFGSDGALSGGTKVHVDSLIGNSYTIIEVRNSKINYLVSYDNFYLDNTFPVDSIMELRVYGDAFISSNITLSINNNDFTQYFGNAVFENNLNIYDSPSPQSGNHSIFSNCIIKGDGYFLSDSNYFDTLVFTIGRTYTFKSNTTQYINDWFDCFGAPGFPIQLVSDNIGQQATLNINQNIFCSDYLYIRDMIGTGSPNLYVGDNSNNVYNNSGWIFSDCHVSLNDVENSASFSIYPNPTSGSLMVDNKDVRKIIIIDGQGNLIKQTSCNFINISEQPNGIYFMKLYTDDRVLVKKVIKQ
ncbi:MAG: hypothetical protein Kow0068_19330 [Marinilabiliales bacterium]